MPGRAQYHSNRPHKLVLDALLSNEQGIPIQIKYRGTRSHSKVPVHRLKFPGIRRREMNGPTVRHFVRSLFDEMKLPFVVEDWKLNVEFKDYDEAKEKKKKSTERTEACLDWNFWTLLSLEDLERDIVCLVLQTTKSEKEVAGTATHSAHEMMSHYI